MNHIARRLRGWLCVAVCALICAASVSAQTLGDYALAVQANPTDGALRLRFAGALLASGRPDAARAQITGMLHDPSARAHQDRLLRALDDVERADPWSFAVTGAFLPSDNIRGAGAEQIVMTPFGPVVVSVGGERQTGYGLRAGAVARYTAVPALGERLVLGADVTRVAYPDAHDLSRWIATPSMTWRVERHRLGYDTRLAATRTVYDEGSGHSTIYALSTGLQRIVSPRLSLSARIGQDWIDYDSRDHLDGTRQHVSFGIDGRATPRLTLRADLGAERRIADQRHNGYDALSLSVGADWAATPRDRLSITLSGERRDHAAPSPVVPVIRHDKDLSLELGWATTRVRIWESAPHISCTYSQTRSNIALLDTDRTDCRLSLVHSF